MLVLDPAHPVHTPHVRRSRPPSTNGRNTPFDSAGLHT